MYDLIIYFTDNRYTIIHNVSNYCWEDANSVVTVEADKRRLFFNMSHVKCIVRVDEMGVKYEPGLRK